MTERTTRIGAALGELDVSVPIGRGVVIRLFAVVVFLAFWGAVASTQPAYFVPGVGAIVEAFFDQLADYGLAGAFARSMATLAVGYAIGVVVGVGVGLAMGVDDRIDAMLDPYVGGLYVAPVSALVPIVILVGGATFESRVFVVFLFVVFDVIVTTRNGVRTTPKGLQEVADSFGASRTTVLRRVVLPHSLPYVFTGLRLGIGRGIKGLILAELLVEFSNLGAIVREWEATFRIAGVLSITVLLMVTGLVLTRLVAAARDRAIPWRTTEVGTDRV